MKDKKYTAKQLKEMQFDLFCKFVEETIETAPAPGRNGIALKFPVDLRDSLENKIKDCFPMSKWTAFLNNSGTLCHVVSPDSEILIRVTFTYPIKHLAKNFQLEAIIGKVKNWIVM